MSQIQDEALKAAGDILIKAYPDLYGSINFNMQGPRTAVLPNITSRLTVQCSCGIEIPVDIVSSKRFN